MFGGEALSYKYCKILYLAGKELIASAKSQIYLWHFQPRLTGLNNQLHMYVFSDFVNLLGSSLGSVTCDADHLGMSPIFFLSFRKECLLVISKSCPQSLSFFLSFHKNTKNGQENAVTTLLTLLT